MERIRSLDSLRGIAALVVVLHHFALVVPGFYASIQAIYPLRPVVAGQAAVLVFFVLSGFVLYRSLERHDRDAYSTFAARRLVRLYPPVAGAILLSAALYVLVDPGRLPGLRGWLTYYSWTERPGFNLLAGHLLLFDGARFHTLDNPMWSLVAEVRLSLLFPLVAAGIRRRPFTTLIVCVIVSELSRPAIGMGPAKWAIDPFFTLQFLELFAVGAFLARYSEVVSRAIRRVPGPLVGAAAFAAFCVSGRFVQPAMHAGAILLVAASLSYPVLSRLYALRPFVWLGARSFSLYLMHVPVLLAAVHAFSAHVPIAVILTGALAASLLSAELFWLAVERPSMRLSRHLGRRWTRRAPAVALPAGSSL